MGFYINNLPVWVEPDFILFNHMCGLSSDEIGRLKLMSQKEETINLFDIAEWIYIANNKDNMKWLLRLEIFIECSKVIFNIRDLSDKVMEDNGVELTINVRG